MNRKQAIGIVSLIECNSKRFTIGEKNGVMYLQAEYEEEDIDTKEMVTLKTRKWILSEHMTEEEIVQTALKCAITSAEHQVRESFTYMGRRIFGPHFSIKALMDACDNGELSYRH